MKPDFNHVIDRHNTYSTQWDYIADRFGRDGIVPFSISDADFACPPEIIETLTKRLEHPIFGYTRWNHADFKNPIIEWFSRRGGAHVLADWIVYSPSVMYTVATLIRMLSNSDDEVVIFNPMYDGFYGAITGNHRKIVSVDLPSKAEGAAIDYDAVYKACARKDAKIFVLTNPHNPTGKIFSRNELEQLVEISRETHTYIISDDIHRDVILGTKKYTPITEVAQKGVAIACSSSKTFNTAGLMGSYAFIPDTWIRDGFLFELKQKNALSSASIMGMYAQYAAYTKCEYYADELSKYIVSNMRIIQKFFKTYIPKIQFAIPDATYLAWFNVEGLGVSSNILQQACVEKGKVGIMSGSTYGNDRYMRMCVACPKSKLERGLEGLLRGVNSL